MTSTCKQRKITKSKHYSQGWIQKFPEGRSRSAVLAEGGEGFLCSKRRFSLFSLQNDSKSADEEGGPGHAYSSPKSAHDSKICKRV